jgi:hypothetical protein
LLDILPEDRISDAVIYEISNFESIILMNENGKLIRKPLPIEAQVSPIKAALVDDFNADGFKDLLLVGNHFGVEVETTRYDSGTGNLLLNDGKNNFHSIMPYQSGFYVPYDSRDIKYLKQGNKKVILVTNNNASLSVFDIK